jgi:glycosyltransferase involved in cell wall biosynthesis
MKYSIVIATYNRAAVLRDTLNSLAMLQPDGPWEVIVVDNNSPDGTRAVVDTAAAAFPAPLHYAFEAEQGRSAALNCGFRLAAGDVVVTTDDDVRVQPEWVNRLAAGLEALHCDYVGGRVTPLWDASPPDWFPARPGLLWGVIALLDYGPEPLKFGRRVPLGVNMAIRRETILKVGGFDARVGRKAGTLLGQEVREWCLRARAAGSEGYYLPDASVQHLIPGDRLTKRYFRRWFYWRGISRALLYAQSGLDMESPERAGLKFDEMTHWFGVPRYLYRSAAVALKDAAVAAVRRDPVAAFERELWLWMFAGMLRQRWTDRRLRPGAMAVPRGAVPSGRRP